VDSKLYVGRPNLGDKKQILAAIEAVLERRWLTNNGPLVQELEARLCDYLGVRHCIPVCNATVGLQVACQAQRLKGEVILPAYTFVATPHSVQWEGLTPVFADIDMATHVMDPDHVESLITERTSAILGVHTWGRPCYPERLQAIADAHGIGLYFDAAHGFGCRHGGRMIGNFGRCEVFSFHATKFFNTCEGGAIATNDDELAERIRLMINFGFSGLDNVVHLGTNGKMSEIHAAMGLACFEVLDEIVATNYRHYEYYRQSLSGLPGIRFYNYDDVEETNYQYIVIEIDEQIVGTSRDALMERMHADGVMARRYFYPGCHRMKPYVTRYPGQTGQVPKTDALCSRVLVLPTGTGVNEEDVERVCGLIVGR